MESGNLPPENPVEQQQDQDQANAPQDSNRQQFELLIYVPKPTFVKNEVKSDQEFNVLALPVTKSDTLHDLKQMIYDSVDGYWLGAIAFERVQVSNPQVDQDASPDEQQEQQLQIPQILNDSSEPVNEHSELSLVFPEEIYPDFISSVRRAVKIVSAPYNEADSRAHVLRARDVFLNISPALQASKYYQNPPYDPSSLAIESGISLFSNIRQQAPSSSSSAQQDSTTQVETNAHDDKQQQQQQQQQSSSKNKKKGGKKSKKPANKIQPSTTNNSNSINESESESNINNKHAFSDYSSETSQDPFAITQNIRSLKTTPKAPAVLKSFSLSPWNPAPHYLRIRGQLLYISAVLLEGEYLHITSTPNGYYVDKSDNNHLDTTPRQPKNSKQQQQSTVYSNLFSLLAAYSNQFATNLAQLFTPVSVFEPLMTFPATITVPAYPWLVDQPNQVSDAIRTQSAYLLTGSTTAETLPPSRDWNEELVQIRELPKNTADERLLRDRVLARFYADFANSAARIVPSIIRGDIPPLNPNESKEMATCIHNNTLFTPAEDALDVYPHLGGHEAARVVVAQDLHGIQRLNAFDIDKLNLMATAIVDYQGERWLAQSLVPGIFNRQPEDQKQEQEEGEPEQKENKDQSGSFRIVYGNLDTENPDDAHVADPEFHKLAQKIAQKANLALHTVTDAHGNDTQLYTSADSHGVVASDSRNYLIDVFRLQPVDVEFLENDITSKPFASSQEKSAEYPHQMVFLRPELVNAYREQERRKWASKIIEEKANKKKEEEAETADQGEKKEIKDKEANGATATANEEEQEAADAIKMDDFKLDFNVDAFVQRKGSDPLTPEQKAARDAEPASQAVRDASQFLRNVAIPALLRDVSSSGFVPGDGSALARHMHSHGVNVRYLGRIANEIDTNASDLVSTFTEGFRPDAKRNLENFKLCLTRNMITRAAKHLLRKTLRTIPQACVSYAVAHFLNCLLDEGYEANPRLGDYASAPTTTDDQWINLTPSALRTSLSDEIAHRYRYFIDPSDLVPSKLAKPQLLREVCLTVGLQLCLRKYDFGVKKQNAIESNGSSSPAVEANGQSNNKSSKKNNSKANESSQSTTTTSTSSSSPARTSTFEAADILNIYPIVKDTPHKSSLAEEMMEQGSICFVRGHVELGETLTNDAVSFYEQVYGNVHPEIANQFHALGIVYHQLAQPLARKINMYQAARAELEQLERNKPQEQHQGTPVAEKYEKQLEEATKLKEESGIESDEQFSNAQKEWQFYLESAVRINRHSVIVAERTLGLDHPDTIQQYADLGILEHAVGNIEVGLLFTKHALDLWNVTFGFDHPETTRRLNNAAQMVQGWKGHQASIPLLIEAHKAACSSRGPDSLLAGNALYNLTQAQCLSGDFIAGLETAKKTAAIFRERAGPEDEKTKETENLVSVIEQANADWAKDAEARASRVAKRLGLDTERAAELLARGGEQQHPIFRTQANSTSANNALNTSRSKPNGGAATIANSSENDPAIGTKGHLDVAELVSYIEGSGSSSSASPKKKNVVRRRK